MQTEPLSRWICDACGYIYDEAVGDPDSGLAPGTRYADIPEDWQCPWCGLRKADLRLLPDQPAAAAPGRDRPARTASTQPRGAVYRGSAEHVVIIGAGAAGWGAAEAIRQRQPERPILLVSACAADVYPKPMLSMALSKGKAPSDIVEETAGSRAERLGVELRTSTRVLKLDPARRRVVTSRGAIDYGDLVLALGAHQRALPVAGAAADTVLRVNDLSSYRKLRQRLDGGARTVTILGAGLIGCEFADDLSHAGYTVQVVDPAAHPLERLLPAALAGELAARLAHQGVQWHFGARLATLEPAEQGYYTATLASGERLHTDLVLSAAGLQANTELARKAGLAVDRGIQVDTHLTTSDAHIHAIGDCAEVDGQVFAYLEPIRRQAEALAAALAGCDEPFAAVPPLIRIKTPSLPLSVCPAPVPTESAAWTRVASDDEGSHFELRDGEDLQGFAMAGTRVAAAPALYKAGLASTKPPSTATASP